jgi:hypothetical protein
LNRAKEIRSEIDCLLILEDDYRIGIEIKGPTTKSNLLCNAGAAKELTKCNVRFTEDVNGLKNCLKKEYSKCLGKEIDKTADVTSESMIGDIIKILNLINEGYRLNKGYCIGLLKYTKKNQNQKKAYKDKLGNMVRCIRSYACKEGFSLSFVESKDTKDICVESLRFLISVVEVDKGSA